ncbi:MAG: LysM peptidoglycan-binding domain-containing protein [Anaerolineales bacterium]
MKTTETEEIIRPSLPDRPPRHCSVCGARVAEGAKICLMCGASLEEEESAAEVPVASPTPHISRRQGIILGVIAIVILGISVYLGWQLAQGEGAPAPPTWTPTSTLTPTATDIPRTPTPTATLTPTPPPTATPTPIPPETYVVQSGDLLSTIAQSHGITVDELKAYNDLNSDIIVEGETLLIPPPTPTPGPTPTPNPGEPTQTPSPYILYTVQSGDTLSTIAEEYNINVDDLREANDIPADSESIQADQVLTIPQYTPTPTPQPDAEAVINATPTPRRDYTSPEPLYPPQDATFNGADALVILQWVSVGILEDNEFYHVELTVPTSDGDKITDVYIRTTAWRVPVELFPPPEVDSRLCTWRVSVVRQTAAEPEPSYKVIGPAKGNRTFIWDVAEP